MQLISNSILNHNSTDDIDRLPEYSLERLNVLGILLHRIVPCPFGDTDYHKGDVENEIVGQIEVELNWKQEHSEFPKQRKLNLNAVEDCLGA